MTVYSVAVLPFKNLTNKPEEDYLADGITEAIMTSLAQQDWLRVTSRVSSFAFQNTSLEAKEIGKQLQVAYLLDGSVLPIEGSLRIVVQLVDAHTGFQLYAESFDHKVSNFLEALDQISHQVVQRFQYQLNQKPEGKLVPSITSNTEAYHAFLRANHHLNKHSPDHIQKALKQYQLAIQLDPDFAAAHVGIANCYFQLGNTGHMKSLSTFPKAKEAIEHAIELDDRLPEAHGILGLIKMYHDLNWHSAGFSFGKALALKREIPTVYRYYAWYLVGLNAYEEAISVLRVALQYDPVSTRLFSTLGDVYRYNRQYDLAIEQYQKALEIDPAFRHATESIGFTYLMSGDFDRAIIHLRKYKQQVNNPLAGNTLLCCTYFIAGKEQEALALFQNMQELDKIDKNRDLSGDFMAVYIARKQYDLAFKYLEQMLNSRSGIITILAEPYLNPLRKETRFSELLKEFILENTVQIAQKGLFQNKENHIVEIFTESNDRLALDPDKFLYAEAQDNYITIAWQESNLLKSRLLRLSVKGLQQQLTNQHCIRCHRSFLVNPKHPFEVTRNSRGYKLHSRLFDFVIPVSRSLAEDVLSTISVY